MLVDVAAGVAGIVGGVLTGVRVAAAEAGASEEGSRSSTVALDRGAMMIGGDRLSPGSADTGSSAIAPTASSDSSDAGKDSSNWVVESKSDRSSGVGTAGGEVGKRCKSANPNPPSRRPNPQNRIAPMARNATTTAIHSSESRGALPGGWGLEGRGSDMMLTLMKNFSWRHFPTILVLNPAKGRIQPQNDTH
jgi:hypothetical protein